MRRILSIIAALGILLLAVPPAIAARPGLPNDEIGGAIAVQLGVSETQVTTRATSSETDAQECVPTTHTVFYSYTATEDGRLLAQTFGSDYDTTIHVLVAADGGFQVIACNDDTAGSVESAVAFDAVAGTTYYFQVGSFADSPGGDLVFTVEPGPPALEIVLTLDGSATLDRATNTVTVSGSVTCTDTVGVEIFGQVSQKVGRAVIQGFFFTFIDCTAGESVSWSASATGETGIFAPGPAQLAVQAFGCNAFECVFTEASRSISIRRQ
jgi:hypothetical protein